MNARSPLFEQAAIATTQELAQQRIGIDQTWQESFELLREYGANLPPEFADSRGRLQLGPNMLVIPSTEHGSVHAVRFSTETVIGFMANQFLHDRKHSLVVPDDPKVEPEYTTWVVNCDVQCVTIDSSMRFDGIEDMMFCPDTASINRRQRTANAIGHMLYALSPENGYDGQERVSLKPGRIIAPLPPSRAKIDKIYRETLRQVAAAR